MYKKNIPVLGLIASIGIASLTSPVFALEDKDYKEKDEVLDVLDESEIVKESDLKLSLGDEFDIVTDFTNIEYNKEAVKLNIHSVICSNGDKISTEKEMKCRAVYYVTPKNEEKPPYKISRNIIIGEADDFEIPEPVENASPQPTPEVTVEAEADSTIPQMTLSQPSEPVTTEDIAPVLSDSLKYAVVANTIDTGAVVSGLIATNNLNNISSYGLGETTSTLLHNDISINVDFEELNNELYTITVTNTDTSEVVASESVTADKKYQTRIFKGLKDGTYDVTITASDGEVLFNTQHVIKTEFNGNYDGFDSVVKHLDESFVNEIEEKPLTVADEGNELIDVDKTLQETNDLSVMLARRVSGEDTTVYNFSATDITSGSINLASNDADTIIVNVDASAISEAKIGTLFKIDGQPMNEASAENFKKLIINFYSVDSKTGTRPYVGSINIETPMSGVIVAPSANVNNINKFSGSIIADSVTSETGVMSMGTSDLVSSSYEEMVPLLNSKMNRINEQIEEEVKTKVEEEVAEEKVNSVVMEEVQTSVTQLRQNTEKNKIVNHLKELDYTPTETFFEKWEKIQKDKSEEMEKRRKIVEARVQERLGGKTMLSGSFLSDISDFFFDLGK